MRYQLDIMMLCPECHRLGHYQNKQFRLGDTVPCVWCGKHWIPGARDLERTANSRIQVPKPRMSLVPILMAMALGSLIYGLVALLWWFL